KPPPQHSTHPPSQSPHTQFPQNAIRKLKSRGQADEFVQLRYRSDLLLSAPLIIPAVNARELGAVRRASYGLRGFKQVGVRSNLTVAMVQWECGQWEQRCAWIAGALPWSQDERPLGDELSASDSSSPPKPRSLGFN
ncbi:hypothetical protein KC19_9G173500, partial [Ceratodon purpureus]